MSDARQSTAEPHGHATHPGDHPFWPAHILDEGMIAFVLLGILLTMAVINPFGLHGKADPLNTPEAIKPEWYFLAVYQLLKYVPKTLGIMAVGAFFGCMFLWPFIDEALARKMGHRKVATFVGWAVLAVVVTLTGLGKICETTIQIAGTTISFDIKAIPHLGGEPHQEAHP